MKHTVKATALILLLVLSMLLTACIPSVENPAGNTDPSTTPGEQGNQPTQGGAGASNDGTHNCNGDHTGWTPLTAHTNMDGNREYFLYLESDLYIPYTEFTSCVPAYIVGAGAKVHICLNGHTLDTGARRVFNVHGTLSLHDCSKDAQGKFHGTMRNSTGDNASIAYLYNSIGSATVNVYGGNYTYVGQGAGKGGFFFLGSTDNGSIRATLNLYDGVLSGGMTQTGAGGAISASFNSVVNMYGGLITGCRAGNDLRPSPSQKIGTGAIQLGYATFNMYGGEITKNISGKYGAVHVTVSAANNTKSHIHLYGGKIYDNYLYDGVTQANISKVNKGPDGGYADLVTFHFDKIDPETSRFGITLTEGENKMLGDWDRDLAQDPTGFLSCDKEGAKLEFQDGVLSVVAA